MRARTKIKGEVAVMFANVWKGDRMYCMYVCVCSVSCKHKRGCLRVWSSNWGTHTDCSMAQGDGEMEKGLQCSYLMPMRPSFSQSVYTSLWVPCVKVNTVPSYMSCPLNTASFDKGRFKRIRTEWTVSFQFTWEHLSNEKTKIHYATIIMFGYESQSNIIYVKNMLM